HDVFGDDARDKEVQQVVTIAGFGSTAAHLESAKRMAANHGASAGAIDVNVSSHELGLHPFDVSRTAREKSGGERVIGIVRNPYRVVQIARFQYTQDRPENFTLAQRHLWLYPRENCRRNEIALFRYFGCLESESRFAFAF